MNCKVQCDKCLGWNSYLYVCVSYWRLSAFIRGLLAVLARRIAQAWLAVLACCAVTGSCTGSQASKMLPSSTHACIQVSGFLAFMVCGFRHVLGVKKHGPWLPIIVLEAQRHECWLPWAHKMIQTKTCNPQQHRLIWNIWQLYPLQN